MAEYQDLSVYVDDYSPFEMLNIGWLGASYNPRRNNVDFPEVLIARLADEAKRPRSLTLGSHECEFCTEKSGVGGNGEIHVYSGVNSMVFSAPTLVLHYVRRHGYNPPSEFLTALAALDQPLIWDSRAATLKAILGDPMAHAGWRVNALFDLPRWSDEQAYWAVVNAVDDEEIVETSSYELGLSLSRFWMSYGKFDQDIYKRLPPGAQDAVRNAYEVHDAAMDI